ncbi:MAG TPA: hypothetical protein VD767_09470 [Thermomicrobiales bacterium]|nr:hypothetical protein [Thermomicrobiales bacterium]
MKTYLADLYFDQAPEPAALVRATANAFGVSQGAVVEGWYIGDVVRSAYANPLIRVVWLQNHELPGPFPHMYTLALEQGTGPIAADAIAERLAAITGALSVAAVMPTVYGKMHLFGPDGSDRTVIRDEESDDDVIRLSPEDQMTLERAYRAIGAVASHT